MSSVDTHATAYFQIGFILTLQFVISGEMLVPCFVFDDSSCTAQFASVFLAASHSAAEKWQGHGFLNKHK